MSAKHEHYDVIRKPIITEKATMASEQNAVVFEVAIESNKPMIKEAVEALFNVKVKAVNTSITKGKVKRFRGQMGRRKDVKKAYVTLEEGNTIERPHGPPWGPWAPMGPRDTVRHWIQDKAKGL